MRLFDVTISPLRDVHIAEGFDVQPAGEDDASPAIHVGPRVYPLGDTYKQFLAAHHAQIAQEHPILLVDARLDAHGVWQPPHPSDPLGAFLRIRVAEPEGGSTRIRHPALGWFSPEHSPGVYVTQEPTLVRAIHRDKVALVRLAPHTGIRLSVESTILEEWLVSWRGALPHVEAREPRHMTRFEDSNPPRLRRAAPCRELN